MSWYYEFGPYVPAAERRAQAAREVAKRAKAGKPVAPVRIEGRAIATTFWGKAWCTNLEGYSDFANRLPRGRTYVRNGSVIDLRIEKGRVDALVSGSAVYTVRVDIAALPKRAWAALKDRCAGKIGTLVELLQGKLSTAVMAAVTDRDGGLFPKPREIAMRCSCPDYAGMCKHVAAVLYGVGHRLDASPELLFALRGVDHQELIDRAIPTAPPRAGTRTLAADDLGAIFGIELGGDPAPPAAAKAAARPRAAARKAVKKPAAGKKPPAAKGKRKPAPKKG